MAKCGAPRVIAKGPAGPGITRAWRGLAVLNVMPTRDRVTLAAISSPSCLLPFLHPLSLSALATPTTCSHRATALPCRAVAALSFARTASSPQSPCSGKSNAHLPSGWARDTDRRQTTCALLQVFPVRVPDGARHDLLLLLRPRLAFSRPPHRQPDMRVWTV